MNIDLFSVKIGNLNFEPSSDNVHSSIVIKDIYFSFPEKEWNDFTVVILSWWVDSILQIMEQKKGVAVLDFMDGPYQINISKEENLIFAEFIRRTSKERNLITSKTYQLKQLVDELIRCADYVYLTCKENGWENNDIIILSQGLQRLKEIA